MQDEGEENRQGRQERQGAKTVGAEPTSPASHERVYQHKTLAAGRWFELDLVEQMANIGSEVERTIFWRNKGNANYSNRAFERALELLDLTLADKKNRGRLKEPWRVREMLVDYFCGKNEYSSTDEAWQRYFHAFAYAAQVRKHAAGAKPSP
jgi:hypothetical protein